MQVCRYTGMQLCRYVCLNRNGDMFVIVSLCMNSLVDRARYAAYNVSHCVLACVRVVCEYGVAGNVSHCVTAPSFWLPVEWAEVEFRPPR